MKNIYLLKLNYSKYYIGYTTKSLPDILEKHRRSSDIAWVKFHRVLDGKYSIELIDSVENISRADSDSLDAVTSYTIEYMKKYGIDNVRGGIFSQMSLKDEEKRYISSGYYSKPFLEKRKMITARFVSGLCMLCGKEGHFCCSCPCLSKF